MQKTLSVPSTYILENLLREDSEFIPAHAFNDLYKPIELICSCGVKVELFHQELKDKKAKACPICRSKGVYNLATWAIQVKLRDGQICKHCLSSDRVLAHHIKPKDKYPELRFELDNGITLCYKCHKLEHVKLNLEAENDNNSK